MGRAQRNTKTDIVQTKDGEKGLQHINSEHYDDNPLPTPEDLAKYNETNPEIINWLMRMSEREQKNRHEMGARRVEIVNDVNAKIYYIDMIRIAVAFIVVLLFLGFSAYLIYIDKVIIGSVFTGITMIAVVLAFLEKNNEKKSVNKE